MARLTDLLNSIIDLALGAAVLASMTLGAAKLVLVRPIEKRLDDAEADIDELDDKASVAKERADRHERVLLNPSNPQEDALVETVEETREIVEDIREMVDEEHDDDS